MASNIERFTSTPVSKLAGHTSTQLLTPEGLKGGVKSSEKSNQESPDAEDSADDEALLGLFRDSWKILEELAKSGSELPEHFWSQVEEYNLSLAGVLDRGASGVSVVNRLIDEDERSALKELVEQVEEKWSSSARTTLAKYADSIENAVRNKPVITHEHAFAKLGRRLLHASAAIPHPALNIDTVEWIDFAPIFMSTQVQELIDRFHAVYDNYQKAVYLSADIDEELKLWYLVSTNLKKILYELSEQQWKSESLRFPLEQKFSNNSSHRKWYQYTASMLDISCMQDFEDLVAEYCKHVHDRLVTDDQAASVALDEETLTVLTQTDTTLEEKIDPRLAPALHKAVARLNYLRGEPSVLRRLGKTLAFYLSDTKLRNEFAEVDETMLDMVLPKKPLQPTWYPYAGDVFQTLSENSDEASNVDVDDINEEDPAKNESDHTRKSASIADNESYVPRGRNLLSAFDYVYSPVPETRAYEVANSRLISRDLRDPGIVSSGLQVDDLVNLPPKHCRTPGTWTTWKQRIPLGPYEIFRLLGSTIMNKLRGIHRIPRPRPLPPLNVTSRHACRHTKHKNKIAAKQDPRTRVSKPKSIQQLGLRGGSRYIPDPDDSPTRRPPRPTGSAHIPEDTEQEFDIYESSHSQDAYQQETGTAIGHPVEDGQETGSEIDPLNAADAANTDRVPLADITEDGSAAEGNDQLNKENAPSSSNGSARRTPQTLNQNKSLNEDIRCHPCPWYRDEFHHHCKARECEGLNYIVVDLGDRTLHDREYFNGSLWECDLDLREFHRVPRDVATFRDIRTIDDFIQRYRWTSGAGRRDFLVSNGARPKIYRSAGGILTFDFGYGPEASHEADREDLNLLMDGEKSLDELPEALHHVQVMEPRSGTWIESELFNNMSRVTLDTLLSPWWETSQRYLISDGNGNDPVHVQLHRSNEMPYERLTYYPQDEDDEIRASTEEASSSGQDNELVDPRPHVRDYAYQGNGDQADHGAQEMTAFQAMLEKSRAERKRKEAEREEERKRRREEKEKERKKKEDIQQDQQPSQLDTQHTQGASEPAAPLQPPQTASEINAEVNVRPQNDQGQTMDDDDDADDATMDRLLANLPLNPSSVAASALTVSASMIPAGAVPAVSLVPMVPMLPAVPTPTIASQPHFNTTQAANTNAQTQPAKAPPPKPTKKTVAANSKPDLKPPAKKPVQKAVKKEEAEKRKPSSRIRALNAKKDEDAKKKADAAAAAAKEKADKAKKQVKGNKKRAARDDDEDEDEDEDEDDARVVKPPTKKGKTNDGGRVPKKAPKKK